MATRPPGIGTVRHAFLASILSLAFLIPGGAAADAGDETRLVAVRAAGAPAPQSAPILCTVEVGGGPGQGLLTVDFFGRNRCGPEPAASMTGQARLLTNIGTPAASGNRFACGPCHIGGSAGSFFPAVPGTSYTVVYDTRVTLPPGHIFGTIPAGCSGVGTATATCTLRRSITA
ncbi:MAG TPA: hypothetical protein VG452_08125 [Egibacteraceae bacterium]|nr:hypothetical protein [Actinomycetota bacterium]HWB72171.1 hypothetical protein [Egibacteraceae bacterium]